VRRLRNRPWRFNGGDDSTAATIQRRRRFNGGGSAGGAAGTDRGMNPQAALMGAPPSQARHRLCDEYLTRAVNELLTHDDRVRGLRLDVAVDGGVVHLTGEVDDARQLELFRRLVGRLAGVFGVWDRVRVAGWAPVALDLGCGDQRQYPENVGVDRRVTGSVAVCADLSASLPFRSASVDRIWVVHLLEHLIDFLALVDECHRVLRPRGVLHVLSPWWGHVNAVADPTHVRLLDVQTIKGICARPGESRRWRPLHVACDGVTVFADLTPIDGTGAEATPVELARFFN
jgi:SAM-dependent methyltransferase